MKKKKIHLAVLLLLSILSVGWAVYHCVLAPTRVAFVNFPSYQFSSYALAADRNVNVVEVSDESSESLRRYDAIMIFGPGYRPSMEQVAELKAAERRGIPVHSFGFATEAVQESALTTAQAEKLNLYYSNRVQSNFRNMLRFIRRELHGRTLFTHPAAEPIVMPKDFIYYICDERVFYTPEELTRHMKSVGVYIEGAPHIALLSGALSPLEGNRAHIDSMITGLTRRGFNVYPLVSSEKRKEMLESISPSAIVYIPMGRLADDDFVQYMRRMNVPLFCPIPVNSSREQWINDPKGVSPGTLTARIVLPEVDGALLPLAISQEGENEEGISVIQPDEERISNFMDNVSRHMALRTKPNAEKKVAIVYFRGPGSNALVATGLEVAPSLYNLLRRMQSEGYDLTGLPETYEEFERILNSEGNIWEAHAAGALRRFLEHGHPEWVRTSDYNQWLSEVLVPLKHTELIEVQGEAPGTYMGGTVNGEPAIAVARMRFGNVVVMPQPRAGLYGDDFSMVHGTKTPPPHAYVAAYLWLRKGFGADAVLHFGTHGSLEFTVGKAVTLAAEDWADRLIEAVPSFYYYTISNVGEGIIAKRRIHAGLVSYLTPPFMESRTRTQYEGLFAEFEGWHAAEGVSKEPFARGITAAVQQLGVHDDLQLSATTSMYSDAEIATIESYIEEIANEKMTGALYTLGEPFDPEHLTSTVLEMSASPLAYSIARLDRIRGELSAKDYENGAHVSHHYLKPVKQLLAHYLSHPADATKQAVYRMAKILPEEVTRYSEVDLTTNSRASGNGDMPAMTGRSAEEPSADDIERMTAVSEVVRTMNRIEEWRRLLEISPDEEMKALLHALSGGYIAPSPGGDVVRNPNTLPTGRNLFSINAESTPTITAWNRGKALAQASLEQYVRKHGDYPRKVSFTLWAGEFIESEGATIAQALYMMGVEPIRDTSKRVTDLRLIPSEELGRPRVDIVVQTSGQLRDLAASRLKLLTRAVELASGAKGDRYENHVSAGTLFAEKELVGSGMAPARARELSRMRVFGAMNGNYGTGIMRLVEKGDAWEKTSELAQTYMNNMNALYGSDDDWGRSVGELFRIALHNTDLVIQPRQNNTWGALSLDHVYEFMGGINASIEEVTGKAPDTYFADYRNRSRYRIQELKEAIGIESRTTLLNPEYIKEKMKGGASSANTFAKTIRNTYGWNAMKTDAISEQLWDELHEVYVKDKFGLGIRKHFEEKNPAALQEITGVMIETARKGMWHADEQQLRELAQLHSDLVVRHGASGSDFLDNPKLTDFIHARINLSAQKAYTTAIGKVKDADASAVDDGVVLRKENVHLGKEKSVGIRSGLIVGCITLLLVVLTITLVRRRRQRGDV